MFARRRYSFVKAAVKTICPPYILIPIWNPGKMEKIDTLKYSRDRKCALGVILNSTKQRWLVYFPFLFQNIFNISYF